MPILIGAVGVKDNSAELATKLDKIQRAIMGGGAIINGGFPHNQREVSGTVVLGIGEYGHDRWRGGSAGCTYTFATLLNVTTITISAGTLEQEIEGVNLESGTWILSWTGTAQGQIDSGGFGPTGVTATLTGGTNAIVEFNTGTLAQVKLEKGSIATDYIPKTEAEELRDSLNYDIKMGSTEAFASIGIGKCSSSTAARVVVNFPEPMRNDNYTFITSGSFSATDTSGSILPITDISMDNASRKTTSVMLNITVASGLVAGDATYIFANNDVNAFIEFDNEL